VEYRSDHPVDLGFDSGDVQCYGHRFERMHGLRIGYLDGKYSSYGKRKLSRSLQRQLGNSHGVTERRDIALYLLLEYRSDHTVDLGFDSGDVQRYGHRFERMHGLRLGHSDGQSSSDSLRELPRGLQRQLGNSHGVTERRDIALYVLLEYRSDDAVDLGFDSRHLQRNSHRFERVHGFRIGLLDGKYSSYGKRELPRTLQRRVGNADGKSERRHIALYVLLEYRGDHTVDLGFDGRHLQRDGHRFERMHGLRFGDTDGQPSSRCDGKLVERLRQHIRDALRDCRRGLVTVLL
jgi:hypothetical protein